MRIEKLVMMANQIAAFGAKVAPPEQPEECQQ